MARTYKRDARGRFASGGGGGGSSGKKAAATRAANTARAKALRAVGTTALGGRLKAKGFAGGRSAQKRAGGLRRNETISGASLAGVTGRGGKMSTSRRVASGLRRKRIKGASVPGVVNRQGSLSDSRFYANIRAAGVRSRAKSDASKAGQRGKSLARTDKKAASPAQARYKELSKRIRAGERYSSSNFSRSGFGSGADAAGARRSKRAMERRRRR